MRSTKQDKIERGKKNNTNRNIRHTCLLEIYMFCVYPFFLLEFCTSQESRDRATEWKQKQMKFEMFTKRSFPNDCRKRFLEIVAKSICQIESIYREGVRQWGKANIT